MPGAQGKQSGAKGLHRSKSERSPVAALALLPLDKGNNSVVGENLGRVALGAVP